MKIRGCIFAFDLGGCLHDVTNTTKVLVRSLAGGRGWHHQLDRTVYTQGQAPVVPHGSDVGVHCPDSLKELCGLDFFTWFRDRPQLFHSGRLTVVAGVD